MSNKVLLLSILSLAFPPLPDVLIELDPPVELDEGKVIVELCGPVEPVVPEDPVGVVLGLLAAARAPRPVVLAQHHLDVVRALLQHAVRRRQHVPASFPYLSSDDVLGPILIARLSTRLRFLD